MVAASSNLRVLVRVKPSESSTVRTRTHEALRLMEVLAARMASEDVWDQSAYNMEIFRPSYGNCARAEALLTPQTN